MEEEIFYTKQKFGSKVIVKESWEWRMFLSQAVSDRWTQPE